MKQKLQLPIDPYLDQITNASLKHSTVILKASPGSGKTTRLPWKLACAFQNKVLVLEPRRLAAKLAANRIAEEEGFTLGHEVGYHFRLEKNYQNSSKLIFYTEGTFLKRLINDPFLKDVDVVILDEFHERHVETDSALAYLRSLQKLRPDFKIVLMSATLDEKLQNHFNGSELIEINSTLFDVEVNYLPNQPSILNQPLEQKIRSTLDKTKNYPGHVLVFVPGMREMIKIKDYLGETYGTVLFLHGDLTKEEQALALNEDSPKKIILSTNIAESSVTIPGVTMVIDCGIQRQSFYSPWNGLKLIKDFPVTKSSAIQRAGRAGRTSHGKCYRLYSEQDFKEREAETIPEILKADLTDTYLWSLQLTQKLDWLTPPPEDRVKKAQALAAQMGAIDANNSITTLGEKILQFPLSARLARVLIQGNDLKIEQKKALVDYIVYNLEGDQGGNLKRRLFQYLSKGGGLSFPWEKCLLTGFLDQVARYRKKQNDFIHYSGKILKAHHSLPDLHHDYYLVFSVSQKEEALTVMPIEEEWLYELEPFPFLEETKIEVKDHFKQEVLTKIGSIPIDSTSSELDWTKINSEQKEKILVLSKKTFEDKWREWKKSETYERYEFVARTIKNDLNLESLICLKDYFNENNLSWDNINDYFETTLKASLNTNIDRELPLKFKIGKKEVPIFYPIGLNPYIEAYIQDFYGLKETPAIASGKIPLTLKLLGPHKRPIQVTQDLKNFWTKTYREMLKEWQREYPKHYWPIDPESAKPFLLKHQAEKG